MTAIALFHFYRISLGQSPFGPPGNQMYHLYSVDSYLKKSHVRVRLDILY